MSSYFEQASFGDGGAPEHRAMQCLDQLNGTWTTITNVSWDKPYNNAYGGGIRRYVIAINNPPTAMSAFRLLSPRPVRRTTEPRLKAAASSA